MTAYPWHEVTPVTGKQPGTEEFARLACKRFGFKNLGTWVVRPVRGGTVWSVHAAGAAVDLGYGTKAKDRAAALDALDWMIRGAYQLGIVAAHDYTANPPRAWRCDRSSWRTFSGGELGPGGRWFHIELSPTMVKDPVKVRKAWLELPR